MGYGVTFLVAIQEPHMGPVIASKSISFGEFIPFFLLVPFSYLCMEIEQRVVPSLTSRALMLSYFVSTVLWNARCLVMYTQAITTNCSINLLLQMDKNKGFVLFVKMPP